MHCRQYSERLESVSARPAAIWPFVNSDNATGDVSAKRVSRAPGEPSPHREPTEIRRTLARNLRQAREAAGLSRSALTKAASCNRGLVKNIEDAAANTTLDTIAQLAKSLGLTEIDLLLPSMENVIAQRVSLALSKTEPTEFRRRFAHNLRQVREAAGLPQRVLARVADLPLSRVWRIEVNAPNVTLDTITQLAKHLGCTEIDLLRPKDP